MARALALINPRISTRNVGDLFIEDSVKKILVYDREASIEIDPRQPISDRDIDRINQTEAAVILGTNLWYRAMAKPGRWTFTLEQLRRIRVPVIPLGIGTTRHAGDDDGFDDDTLAQIRWMHASCALGGARDERTAEVLRAAGVRNVAMTGCPTLYRSLAPEWKLRPAVHDGRVVVTVRKGQRRNVRRLLGRLARAGLDPIVAAQQAPDNFLRPRFPFYRAAAPTLYQYDIGPYLDLVRGCQGAIGWRLHGNMLHLAHGNPAVFLANCSRAESFCRTFGLPVEYVPDGVRLGDRALVRVIERLFDPAAFALLPERYQRYRAEMASFLEANDLEHRLARCSAPAAHESKAA